jgi:hypothetical protein
MIAIDTCSLRFELPGPTGVLPVEPSGQGGEGEKAPHRQYRIYSNDVPPLISYPLLHNDYPDIDDDPDNYNVKDTDHDPNTEDDNALSLPSPSLEPNPLPNPSNNNDHHDYQNSNALCPNPTPPSLPSIIPLPVPSASSLGGSFKGEVPGEIGAVAGSGALLANSESYTYATQTIEDANYTRAHWHIMWNPAGNEILESGGFIIHAFVASVSSAGPSSESEA